MRLFLCGEDTTNLHDRLQYQLVNARGDPLLSQLFSKTSSALRREVASLPAIDRHDVPAFSTLDELNDRSSGGSNHAGIENALNYVSAIAGYIRYVTEYHPQIGQDVAVGVSTGTLAAATVALSPFISTLIPLATEIALLAFRLGLYIRNKSQQIGSVQNHDGTASWSSVKVKIIQAEMQHILDSYKAENKPPLSKLPYISGSGSDFVILTGPRAIVDELAAFDKFASAEKAEQHSTHPYHAPHLNQEQQAREIVCTINPRVLELLDTHQQGMPLVTSGIRHNIQEHKSMLDTFQHIVHEILRLPYKTSALSEGIAHLIEEHCPSTRQIVICGPTSWRHDLTTSIQKDCKMDFEIEESEQRFSASNVSGDQRTTKNQKLAIVGMAGRFPDAADHEKFWALLEAGLDVHREVPSDRWDVKKYYDPASKARNTSHTPFGCWVEEPGLFDPRFFNMSPREATQTDPMHRLGLATAYEALEMAGYVPNRTPSTRLDRIGTFYGQTSDDWREINAAQDVDTYFITGGVRAFAPGRINYHFKFTGPSFNIDTACSSSAAAIQLACTSLWAGDCDTAVAGGLNIMTNSDIFAGLSRGQFLSKTGNCQTYDNDADGYCRGDGIGSIIIKRLEDAEADNDRILSVISGIATNHSSNAISITHPHAPTQEELFTRVMKDAALDPHEVDYVEMHGTGTQAGDSTEMESVTNVFAPSSRVGTRTKPLHIGSVKANVGHGEAVSGVTAFIKVMLMMQNDTIPPHCGIKRIQNRGFPQDLEQRNVHIAFKPTSFPAPNDTPRRIFVNNFSAAGGNTATLLEDAPRRTGPKDDARGSWVVAVSAKSKAALSANTRNLVHHLKHTTHVRLPDLSYTTTARRIQHNYRIAIACESVAKAIDELTKKLDIAIEPVSSTKANVGFAFTGQGSQYSGLGSQLYNLSSMFRADLTNFDGIGSSLGYPSFMPFVDGSVDVQELSPLVVQLGLTCVQMAMTRWWASLGIKPSIVLGHSLGEYAALNAAGVISVSDTIYLVGERAKLLQEKCTPGTHAMLAVKSTVNALEDALYDVPEVEFACVNGPNETVMAGPLPDINALAEKLGAQGVKCTKLDTPYAFHSSQVDPILSAFENVAEHVRFNKPKVPVISPLLANILSEEGTINGPYLSNHARRPVNFSGGLAAAWQAGLVNEKSAWVELGPHPICSGFIKSQFGAGAVTAPTLRKGSSPYKTISESLSTLHLAGLDVDWNEYHRDFIDCVRMLDLPAYAWDNKNYWIKYSGDWNLRKGELAAGEAVPQPEASKLSTTSVQKIVSEDAAEGKVAVTTESDISDPALLQVVSGHMVNGTALCPSSLYADMALTLGNYMQTVVRPDAEPKQVDVSDMKVFKPFIANDGGKGQSLRLTGTTITEIDRGTMLFSSGSGKAQIEHARCTVSYGSGTEWLSRWQRQAYLISQRIEHLEKAAQLGQAHRMLRGMAYKLFGAFVEYDQKYRGMEEVILDSPEREATAKITFQTTEADGDFFCNPYWIDSICHLAGFIVNANDTIDSSKQVYVSHGWESLRFAEPLVKNKTYRSYVKMQPMPDNVMAGDVYFLDGDRIIGMCETLKFQCIPRSMLNTFLPPKGAKAVTTPSATKTTAAINAQPARPSRRNTPTIREPARTGPSVIDKVVDIIAAECGVPLEELSDPVDFSNLGVDSLMSLAISSRVREELNIGFESTTFVDHPTIGAVKGFLRGMVGETEPQAQRGETLTASVSECSDVSSSAGSASTQITPPDSPDPTETSALSTILRQTISDGMEVDMAELMSIEDLSSVGMDSLMALTLLATLREKAGLDLPADFFVQNTSIKAMETALNISASKPKPGRKALAQPSPRPLSEPAPRPVPRLEPPVSVEPATKATNHAKQKIQSSHKASSMLLQGNTKTATKSFWLIPDGGGAPTSYIFPSTISPTLAVWGLVSPFLKTPENFIVGVTGIASLYVAEMRRRQPTGPYHLGGWSAGGVISYEICQQLLAAGEDVRTLVLIDTPCPLIIEPLPASLHRFFASIGLLGEGDGVLEKLPPWLLPHFAASVHALSTYDAAPLPKGNKTMVWCLWCEDGVCKHPDDPKPVPYLYGHAQFLLENRTDFGPQEWRELIPEPDSRMKCEHMEGNHFSMMREPFVGRLVEFLTRALA